MNQRIIQTLQVFERLDISRCPEGMSVSLTVQQVPTGPVKWSDSSMLTCAWRCQLRPQRREQRRQLGLDHQQPAVSQARHRCSTRCCRLRRALLAPVAAGTAGAASPSAHRHGHRSARRKCKCGCGGSRGGASASRATPRMPPI